MPSRPCATSRRPTARISLRSKRPPKSSVEASINQQQMVPEGHRSRGRQDARAARDLEKARRIHRRAEDVHRSRTEVVSRREGQGRRAVQARIQGSGRRLQELPRQFSRARRISVDDRRHDAVPDPRAGLGCSYAAGPLAHGARGRRIVVDRARPAALEWHRWSGYTLLGLVASASTGDSSAAPPRGSGSSCAGHARSWVISGALDRRAGPQSVRRVERRRAARVAASTQVALGLFAVDVDGIESGPLSSYVSFETGRAAAEWHEAVFNVLHVPRRAAHRGHRLVPLGEEAASRDSHVSWLARLSAGAAAGAGRLDVRLGIGIVLAVALAWSVSRAFDF